MPERPVYILADDVINKIAAGEVVERPSSVVKELIENSLDAGASRIDVELSDGGRRLIRVADDGAGMSRDNALLAVERHATSKIRAVEDITRIGTLGFRGEALAAISSVCRFRLQTRPASRAEGTEITISGGKLQDVRETGCPPGTSVEVRALFFNVPARRRFLRSVQTELARVKQLFAVYALAHVKVGMSLAADGRTLYALPAGATREERLRDLFRLDPSAELRPVAHACETVKIGGYVGLPADAGPDRSGQMFFINGRPASAPLLHAALREAYRSLAPRERYPAVFLFLETAPEDVDVNVHPTKQEVRFHKPTQVRDAVMEAVRTALAQASDAANPLRSAAQHPILEPPPEKTGAPCRTDRNRQLFPYPAPAAPFIPENSDGALASVPPPRPEEGSALETGAGGHAPWRWRRVLGQAGGKYAILETDDGLAIMDPHAAHERVLYERFMRQIRAGNVQSQGLLAAESVELAPKEAAMVCAALDLLRRMGFGISEFDAETFLVDAVPACLGGAQPKTLLLEIAACLEAAGEKRAAVKMMEEPVARAACKAAVKTGKQLDEQDMEALLQGLEAAEMPYTCPHGRPTLVYFSFRELDKRFGRRP